MRQATLRIEPPPFASDPSDTDHAWRVQIHHVPREWRQVPVTAQLVDESVSINGVEHIFQIDCQLQDIAQRSSDAAASPRIAGAHAQRMRACTARGGRGGGGRAAGGGRATC